MSSSFIYRAEDRPWDCHWRAYVSPSGCALSSKGPCALSLVISLGSGVNCLGWHFTSRIYLPDVWRWTTCLFISLSLFLFYRLSMQVFLCLVLDHRNKVTIAVKWATRNFCFPSVYTREWRRKRHPTPALLPGASQGQRSLLDCRLWGARSRTRLTRLSSSGSANTVTLTLFWSLFSGPSIMSKKRNVRTLIKKYFIAKKCYHHPSFQSHSSHTKGHRAQIIITKMITMKQFALFWELPKCDTEIWREPMLLGKWCR